MRKYGKLLLSAYIMKKLKSGVAPKGRGTIRRYLKLAAGAYLLNKLKSVRVEKEVEAKVESEEEMILSEAKGVKTGKGSSMKIGKIILGGLVGATLIYALKKRAAKKRGYNINVE
ncbi:MAG TPA: hypothetical protein VGK06_08665 [Methanosarcina sp.]|jgi:hypothetical protein